jgi:hypothetical protein
MKRIKLISGVYLVQILALCYSIINGLLIPFFFSLEITSSIFLFVSPLAIVIPLASLIDAIFVSSLVSGKEISYRLFSALKFYAVLVLSSAILWFYHQSILFNIAAVLYAVVATQGALFFNIIQAKGFTRASIRLYIIHISLQLLTFVASYFTSQAYQMQVYAGMSILVYFIVVAFEIRLIWPMANYGKSFYESASYIFTFWTSLPLISNSFQWPTNMASITYISVCDFLRTGAPVFLLSILIKGQSYAIARVLISLCLVVVSFAPVNPSLFYFLNKDNMIDLRSYVQLRSKKLLLVLAGSAILISLFASSASWLYWYILSPSSSGEFSFSHFVVSASVISVIFFLSRCLAFLTYVQSSLIGLKNPVTILIAFSSVSLALLYLLVTQVSIPFYITPSLIVIFSLLPILAVDFSIVFPSHSISRDS